MAGVFEPIVGSWGAALINIGLIVSVGGAFLSWSLLCAEIPYTCARDGTFPKWFAAENANGSPKNALLATNIMIQLFLVLSFFSKSAYQFFYFIASAAILPPYVLSGAYALKLALSGDGYGSSESRTRDIVVGAAATIYGPVARLCRGRAVPADVRGSVCSGHRGLSEGTQGTRRASLHSVPRPHLLLASACWPWWRQCSCGPARSVRYEATSVGARPNIRT